MKIERTSVVDFVWVALCIATLASWWLAEHQSAERATVLVVLALAAVKVWLVVMHFMEVKAMPRTWQLAFQAWLSACTVMIAVFTWFG